MIGSPDGPDLPRLDDSLLEWREAKAKVTEVSGRPMLMLPFAAPVGRSRGRPYRVGVEGRAPRIRVILSVAGQAVVRADAAETAGQDQVSIRIQPLRRTRLRVVPGDLTRILAERGLSIDVLPDHELEQVLLMVAESASAAVRQARLQAAVTAVAARSRHAAF